MFASFRKISIISNFKIYHFCHEDGKQDTFQCGYGTVFNEYIGTCDFINSVQCLPGEGYAPKRTPAQHAPYAARTPNHIQLLYSTKNVFHIPNTNDTMNLLKNTNPFLTANLLHISNLLYTANLLVTIYLHPPVRKLSRAQVPTEQQGKL